MGSLLNMSSGSLLKTTHINWADEHLTFKALESGTFQFTSAAEYSINKGEWTALAASTATPTLQKGDTIRWRATITPTSSAGVGTFSATCYYNAMGNPLSLNLGDSFVGVTTMPNREYMFYRLFYQDTHIKSARNLMLTCTTLRGKCYREMFKGCVSLTEAAYLPYLYGQHHSCNGMYYGCSSLVMVETINIMDLLSEVVCYEMFRECTSLTKVPINVLTTKCQWNSFAYMFYGCTSLVDADIVLPADNITTSMYSNMFYGCTSLRKPPVIMANRIHGMGEMFRNCTSLETAPTLEYATGAITDPYTYRMFQGCTNLKTPPLLRATVLKTHCYYYFFNDCSSLEIAPVLPAEDYADNAYSTLFGGCSKLRYIKCLLKGTIPSIWMFTNGVAANGTFVKHPDSTWTRGNSGIPNGWTVLEAVQITVTYTGDNSGAYLKEIGGSEIIHTFIDGEPYEADLDDNKSYGVYDSDDNLIQTLATPFSRTVSITI